MTDARDWGKESSLKNSFHATAIQMLGVFGVWNFLKTKEKENALDFIMSEGIKFIDMIKESVEAVKRPERNDFGYPPSIVYFIVRAELYNAKVNFHAKEYREQEKSIIKKLKRDLSPWIKRGDGVKKIFEKMTMTENPEKPLSRREFRQGFEYFSGLARLFYILKYQNS